MAAAMGGREWGMLLALSLVWGGSFFFTGVAVRDLPAFTIVAARVAIGAAALLLLVRAAGQRMPGAVHVWAAFFCMGLLNNAIPFVLIVWGQHHIASGLAAILNATTPLFTVLAAHVLTTDEKLSAAKFAGVLAGLAGVVVLLGPDLLEGFGTTLLAQAACLVAALSYACAGIYGRRFRRMGLPPLSVAAGQVMASTVLMLPLCLMIDRPWALPVPGGETIASLLGIGLLSTALAYNLYFRILAAAGATNLLLVTFLIPVSAILLGSLVLGEALLIRHFAGMALIAAGLAAIDGRVWRLLAGVRHAAPQPGK